MGFREQLGAGLGVVTAPAVTAITKLRHARMFHPRGYVFAGQSDPIDSPFPALSEALVGRVLARCSAALWRRWEHFDVLGLALRIRPGAGPDLDVVPRAGDQDLLTATIRSPLTMLGAPFFTDATDFVGNKYWAVSPFEHGGLRFELRLVPIDPPKLSGNREERLRRAVDEHRAAWWLQARKTLTPHWHSIDVVELERPLDIDQETLAFDPFRGALHPVGVVHAIRRAVYAAGQATRPREAHAPAR